MKRLTLAGAHHCFQTKKFQILLQLASQVNSLAMASCAWISGFLMITRRGEWWSSPWRVAQKFEKFTLFHVNQQGSSCWTPFEVIPTLNYTKMNWIIAFCRNFEFLTQKPLFENFENVDSIMGITQVFCFDLCYDSVSSKQGVIGHNKDYQFLVTTLGFVLWTMHWQSKDNRYKPDLIDASA